MKISNFSAPISKQVFISRYLSDDSIFKAELNAMGYTIIDQSLITASQIRYSYAPKSDWIFFSGKNSIKYFFEQNPQIDPKTLFAVLSEQSAGYLNKFGKSANFIGKGNDVVSIAKEFTKLITTETVLFPQSIDSLQTVQRQLSFANISKSIYVYKTELKSSFEIPKCEILVFTSPSNATAYFEKYNVSSDQKVVAIGTSTLQRLKSFGATDVILSDSFSEKGLVKAVLEKVPAFIY